MMETHNAFQKAKWKVTTSDGWIQAKGEVRKTVVEQGQRAAKSLKETLYLCRRDRDSNDYEVVDEIEA